MTSGDRAPKRPASRPRQAGGRRVEQLVSDNSRLRQLVMRDDLTGLANRRAFLARLNEEVARADRYGGSFSVLLLDLDGLKDINDTFGHQTGDAALRHFAGRLAAAARASDLVARVGGDEFAVIAIHTSSDQGPAFGQRLAAVAGPAAYHDPRGGRSIMVSAAAGVATFSPECATAEELFARADLELNRAKQERRSGAPIAAGTFVPRGRRAAADEVRALLAMARDVVEATSPAATLRRAVAEAARLIAVERAAAGLIGLDGRVHYDECWIGGRWFPWGAAFAAGERLTGGVLASGVARVVTAEEDAAADEPLMVPALAAPVRASDGTVLGVLTLARRGDGRPFGEHDLTLAQAFADLSATVVERVRAHAASEAARAYLRNVIDLANDVIIVADPESDRIVDANPAAERALGYSAAELRRMRATELVPAEDGDTARSLVGRVVESRDGRAHGILRQQRRDGTTRTFDVNLTLMDWPGSRLVLVLAHDVTERQHAEEDLRRAYDHLRSLIDQAADAILVIDPRAGTIIDANPAAQAMLGYTREELLRLTGRDLRAPASRSGPSLSEMAVAAGHPVRVARHYQRKDGTIIPIEGSAAVVNSPLGAVVFIMVREIDAGAVEPAG